MAPVSLRTALAATLTAVAVLSAAAIGWLGSADIRDHVVREAQARVDRDLDVLVADHQRRLEAFAAGLVRRVEDARITSLDDAITLLRNTMIVADCPVLTVCDAGGRPLAGSRAPEAGAVPLSADPVLRRAARGTAAWGVVRFDSDRLSAEAGDAMARAVRVAPPGGGEETGDALFWWVGVPIHGPEGRVTGLVYGGRPLNHDYELVDALRGLAFGDERYGGRPLGTVTVFLDDLRIATNVLDGEGRRAVGTLVSDEVRRYVLGDGERWSDRARVLDDWYLSGYAPLRDPDEGIVGMLYVGLLEAPYTDLQAERRWQFLGMVGLIAVASILTAFLLVGRMTRPLARLGRAAEALAQSDWNHPVDLLHSYAEIERLAGTFEEMRRAIVERDQRLVGQNQELSTTNEALTRANANYMTMLGFVTHELKAPLAAIQMMSNLVTEQFGDSVPEQAAGFLVRIRRSCEELQDMVRDYLALSRAERGELAADPSEIDLRAEVVEPSLKLVEPLFRNRSIELVVDVPDGLRGWADPELLRIAVSNLLTNAAKYGRADGRARVVATPEGERVRLSVENDGEGFTDEEARGLFGKFVRLRNATTRERRGSGLGLYLVRQIARLHGGDVLARSEPGRWARFEFSVPVGPVGAREPRPES